MNLELILHWAAVVIVSVFCLLVGWGTWCNLRDKQKARKWARESREKVGTTVHLHFGGDGNPLEGAHGAFDPRTHQRGLTERRERWIARLDEIQAEEQALQDEIDELTK